MDKTRFLRSWRWFGPSDPISLEMIRQTKAEAIVTALHHIPSGTVWSVDEIEKRKNLMKSNGYSWSVAESLPVHEEIKYRGPNIKKIIENYKQSLRNLGTCGIPKVCYNFMPVIDWVRTDLNYPWKNKGISMLFDYPTFAAFDVFILKRPKAELSYSPQLLAKAQKVFEQMTEDEKNALAHSIIVVTQGFIHGGVGDASDYKKAFQEKLNLYQGVTPQVLKENLSNFLEEILPVAEESGITMCLHPDDPPFPVLGLPRIACNIKDYQWIMDQNPSPSNGITFCSGSLSSRKDNDLLDFLKIHTKKVHFAHLRNTTILTEDGTFCESGHLEGGANMREIVRIFHEEMYRRKTHGIKNWQIPMRPDHGLKLADDQNINANPGYPFYGRMKGLAEIISLEDNS